jgi:hypothetical protein
MLLDYVFFKLIFNVKSITDQSIVGAGSPNITRLPLPMACQECHLDERRG